MRRQSGQALILVALLSTVLIGFLGLVIDGGEVAAQQQLVQGAADGAALGGAYAISQPAATTATATTLAQDVLANLGLPTSDLTISFLDSSGAPTASPSAVATVQSTVNDARATFFLKVLGIASATVTGRASARAGGTACALCVLGIGNTTVQQTKNSSITVTGSGAIVDSVGTANLNLGMNAAFSAPSVTIAGGSYVLGKGATITPAPVVGSAVADPFTLIPIPTLAGSAVSYSSPTAGSGSIAPGIYSSLTVNGTYSLTMSAGVYVITGPLSLSGGSLTASGVLLFLGCGTYPSGCAAPTTSCGSIDTSGGSASLTAPASGTYARLALFSDRNCTATNVLGNGAVVTGTIYTRAMALSVPARATTTLNATTVLDNLAVGDGASLTISYSGSQNYSSFGLTV